MERVGLPKVYGIVILLRAVQHTLLRLGVDACRSRPRSELRRGAVDFLPEAVVGFIKVVKETGRRSVCRIRRVDDRRKTLDVLRKLLGEISKERYDNSPGVGDLGRGNYFESSVDLVQFGVHFLPDTG